MTNSQRCGTIDNAHIFIVTRRSTDSSRCQLCNKHIRDVHISDHIVDGSANSARIKNSQRRKLGL
jgi:hypothetical protein